ncbi:histidine phosphatase superfamily [Cokeromyces recurvatus]|uniref:histidine phosphatase superfamily n=1 Tax=Cokeromyces recurvatus TaxID=90255 RepID=UPI00221ECB57|nr:histidine phosphatase superfamily [Cokeromyces recurvatus]KAI7900311.1 histidine phosphatase superfamily [Cokeromyces recurvatus]
MSLLVTLVRHGNTNANNERWLQGHTDTDLNENGLKQADSCGERLKEQNFDHVYCSDLKRCKQTASAILSYQKSVSIDYLPLLRERDFGKLSRQPLKYLNTESQRLNLTIDQFIVNHQGESEKTFRERAVAAWKFIIKDAQEKKYRSILVVTHGGPLKYLSSYWIESGFKTAQDGLVVAPVAQGNTAITRISVTDKLIYEFNSTNHLKEQNSTQPPPPAV